MTNLPAGSVALVNRYIAAASELRQRAPLADFVRCCLPGLGNTATFSFCSVVGGHPDPSGGSAHSRCVGGRGGATGHSCRRMLPGLGSPAGLKLAGHVGVACAAVRGGLG